MANREISSSNPAVRVFTRVRAEAGEGTMTLGGTLAKSAILVLLTVASAVYTWSQAAARPEQLGFLIMVGAIGGLIVGMLTIFKPHFAPITAPFYAVLQGLALGGISTIYNARYAGLPMQAVALTFGVALVMLGLYSSGVVRATPRFRKVIVIAALGILAVYLTNLVMGFFGSSGFAFVTGATPMGIAFSVVASCVAAFFLILDFDLIEQGIRSGAPKRLEWYGGFTLLMTLVWLYLELLRLLDKLRR